MNLRVPDTGRNLKAPACLAAALVAGLLIVLTNPATAATLTVTTLNDNVAGSLRTTINNSTNGDTIQFTNTLFGTLNLTNGELVINHSLTIFGPGATTVAVSAMCASRVFNVTNGNVMIAGLTIRDGVMGAPTNGANALGGGVFNSASLTLSNCAILNNLAAGSNGVNGASGMSAKPGSPGGQGLGGGIYNTGTLVLRNCTLAENEARGGHGGDGGTGGNFGASGGAGGLAQGGAIFNDGTLTNSNCTLSTNRVSGGNGGDGQAGGFTDGNGGKGGNAEGAGLMNRNFARLIHVSIINNFADSGSGGSTVMPGTGTNGLPGLPLGGGVYAATNTTYLLDTLTALNSLGIGAATNSGFDVYSNVVSQGFNLIGITNGSSGWTNSDLKGTTAVPLNPQVGPLQYNGGQTTTHLLLFGSPAIDRGSSAGFFTDQIGLVRPYNSPFVTNAPSDSSDIGACEWTPTPDVWLNGGSSQNWSDATNWSTGSPTLTSAVYFTNSGVAGDFTQLTVNDSTPTNSINITDMTIGQVTDPDDFNELDISGQASTNPFIIFNNLTLLPGGLISVNGTMPLRVDGTTTIASAPAPVADPSTLPALLEISGSAQLNDVVIASATNTYGALNLYSGSLLIKGTLTAGAGPTNPAVGVLPSNGSVQILGPSMFIHTNNIMNLGVSGLGHYYQTAGTGVVQGVLLGGPGPYAAGLFNIDGGTFIASQYFRMSGTNSASFPSRLDISSGGFFGPGKVYVTNAAHTAFVEVGKSSALTIHPGGLLQVDKLFITNSGSFSNLGGTFQVTSPAQFTNGNASFLAGTNAFLNDVLVGSSPGSTSSVAIASSVVTIGSNLTLIAAVGSSILLDIRSNSAVNVSANITVSSSSTNSPGVITVSSGSSLSVSTGKIAIGPAGGGLMNISGGTVIAPKIHLGGTGAVGKVIFSSGFVRTSELLCNWWVGNGGEQDGNGGTMILGSSDHDSLFEIHAPAVSTNWGAILVGTGNNLTGTFTNDGGIVSVTTNMVVGDYTTGNSATGMVALTGTGQLYVTNAAHNAVLEVRQGRFAMTGGKLVVDILRIQNPGTGTFIHSGGQLVPQQMQLDPNHSAVGDGIANSWKMVNGFDPLDPTVASADPDHDGLSNYAEFRAGTNPNSATSAFRVLGASTVNVRDVRLQWTTTAGHQYVVQTNSSLTDTFKDSSGVITAGPGEGTATYIHPGGATNRTIFYRVRLDP